MKRLTRALHLLCAAIAAAALGALSLRAALRLEPRWDTFWYHLPFAALRGGLKIPYQMTEAMELRFQGFPPLPHLLEGILWRVTGSINATGVVGMLAFLAFLAWCQFALRARASLVALISLTAPLVIIHCAASYVDLFGNALLAIGAASLLKLELDETGPRGLLYLGGLLGLAGAAWSKFQLVAVVVLFLLIYLIVCLRSSLPWSRTQRLLAWLGAALLAATPYLKNLAVYRNPFWPVRVPFFPFPYAEDEVSLAALTQTPPPLLGHSRLELFVRSLFEWDLPTHYGDRPRWVIDQGGGQMAFRMGGYWGVGAAIWLVALAALLLTLCRARRAGLRVLLASLAVLAFIACLPQSHDLRYYLFIPLTWAAALALLAPKLEDKSPRLAAVLLLAILGLFGCMAWENRTYYRIERAGIPQAARAWNAERWWPILESGERHCAIDMSPVGLLLTGPTLAQYSIVERKGAAACPAGTIPLTADRFLPMRSARQQVATSASLFQAGNYRDSIAAARRALVGNPDSSLAYNNLCAAYNALQQWDAGVAACQEALARNPTLQIARNNLAEAIHKRDARK